MTLTFDQLMKLAQVTERIQFDTSGRVIGIVFRTPAKPTPAPNPSPTPPKRVVTHTTTTRTVRGTRTR